MSVGIIWFFSWFSRKLFFKKSWALTILVASNAPIGWYFYLIFLKIWLLLFSALWQVPKSITMASGNVGSHHTIALGFSYGKSRSTLLFNVSFTQVICLCRAVICRQYKILSHELCILHFTNSFFATHRKTLALGRATEHQPTHGHKSLNAHGSILWYSHRYTPDTSYTTLCNGVVSHGGQFGVFGFLSITYANICKTNAFMIFTCSAAFCICLSSRSDHSTCR